MSEVHEPYKVYLADVSYFSGKLEAYFRYKEIPFERVETNAKIGFEEIYQHTGVLKVPAVKTADGLWLKDTTPMLDWFEEKYPEHPIMPVDPTLLFVSKLVEDYADEWCWRSAMYFRWRDPANSDYLSQRIGKEVLGHWPIPTKYAGMYFKRRQRKLFLYGDGLTNESEQVIRQQYFDLLEGFNTLLKDTPFLLGNSVTLVDIAFMGPFFRHYFCDPEPAKIMRDRYPLVMEWVVKVWNAKASQQEHASQVRNFTHEGWQKILKEICQDYIPYLVRNAQAWHAKEKHFDFEVNGVTLPKLPVIQYRVYCLELLEIQYKLLEPDAKCKVDEIFKPYGSLMLNTGICSGLAMEYQLPLSKRSEPIGWLEKLTIMLAGTPWDMPKHFRKS